MGSHGYSYSSTQEWDMTVDQRIRLEALTLANEGVPMSASENIVKRAAIFEKFIREGVSE